MTNFYINCHLSGRAASRGSRVAVIAKKKRSSMSQKNKQLSSHEEKKKTFSETEKKKTFWPSGTPYISASFASFSGLKVLALTSFKRRDTVGECVKRKNQ